MRGRDQTRPLSIRSASKGNLISMKKRILFSILIVMLLCSVVAPAVTAKAAGGEVKLTVINKTKTDVPMRLSGPGSYTIDVKLFSDGAFIGHTTTALEVIKAGFEQYVADAAQDHGLLYGLATTAMALLTGWFASAVFRRD